MRILKIGKSLIFGVEHYNMDDVSRVLNYVKKNFKPEDKIIFMGEGGDDNNVYEAGGEQEAIKNGLEAYFNNFINDSWDGKETNVLNSNSFLYKEMESKSGLSHNKTMAAVYVIIVGQSNNSQEMSGLLTSEGIEWIKTFGVENPEEPTEEDINIMYDLCFPQDSGKPVTEMTKITNIFNEVRDKNLLMKIKSYHSKGYKVIATAGEGHIDLIKNIEKELSQSKTTKADVDEMMGADAAGAFVGPISGVKQEPKEQEFTEATDASSSGAYSDVPAFGKTTKGGRKDPLKIDGPSSIYKGRAVTDKNFPKWGGPDSVFIKIKDKCKKFPYCNQGDINAIQIVKEDKELQIAITETSKKYGISYSQVENIVLNEINKIFI
jgi:hypothetical protein